MLPRLPLLLAIGAAALLAGCDKPAPPPAPAKSEPGVVSFAAGAPELDALQLATAELAPLPVSADLNARLAVDESVTGRVGTPVAGRVLSLSADIGDAVRRGQVLAVVDAPDLAQARADLLKAEADAGLKSRALTRARALFAGEAVARRDVESAEADAGEANAELQRARLRLANLGGGRGDALALSSPIAGYVIERKLNPGQQLSAGDGPLFTVTDPRQLWLYVDLPESAVGRARIGEDIQFDVEAWPDRHFRGRIDKIGLAVDPATRRVQLRASVANGDLALKPEMYARARLVTDDGRTALRVPNAALFEQGLKSYAFRMEGPGRFRRVPVEVASRGEDMSFVTAGLKPGDRIVGQGALLLNAQLAGDQ